MTGADGRLGLCDVLPGGPNPQASWAQLAAGAGARLNRWEFRWDRIQPKPGTWNFAADDPAVDSSLAAGIDIVGILIGTPAWAAAAGQKPGNGVPRGLGLNATDASNLWASYVRGVVLHYRGEVRTWEIWNEPDLPFFWSGSPDDYFTLMSVAYAVIKSIDPAATVLMAGMVVPDLGFFTRVVADTQDRMRAQGEAAFDAAAWHAYGRAALLYTNLERMRSTLASHGFAGVPVWVTEDGFPASNPNGEPRQAAYVLQTILYSLAGGADKTIVYRASDDSSTKSWGILSATGEPRMGYLAYQVAARFLAHAQAVTYEPGASASRFEAYEPGRRLTVAWSNTVAPQTVSLPAGPDPATLVDWQGASSTVAASNGSYTLSLPGASYNSGIDATGSVVGGPPLLLIEANTASPNAPAPGFLPSLAGGHRRLVLLNEGSDADVQVRAASAPKKHAMYRIPAGGLQTIDLDLLAGPQYAGSYEVSTPPGVSYAGASDQTLAAGSIPASVWYGADARGTLMLSNPSATSARLTVDLYASTGTRSSRTLLTLAPHGTTAWMVPATRGHLAAAIRSSQPIVVGAPAPFTSHASPSWYAVHPTGGKLRLYNPGPASTPVDIRFVGARAVTGQQLELGSHQSYALSTHGAKAMVISASRPIASASAGQAGFPVEASAALQSASLAAAGPATKVSLFNPTSQPAHISYTLVSRAGVVQHTLELLPSHLSTLVARHPSDPARGVLLRSDTPVVALPSR